MDDNENDNIININEAVKDKQILDDINYIHESQISDILEYTIERYMGDMLDVLQNNGLDTYSDQFRTDFSVSVEMIKATVLRTYNQPHILHSWIDNHFEIKDEQITFKPELDNLDE